MRVAFDTNMLSHLLSKGGFPPTIEVDGVKVSKIDNFESRVKLLVAEMSREDVEPIVIPAQVFAEFLAKGEDAARSYMPALMNKNAFKIVPYGAVEAIETSHIDLEVRKRTSQQDGTYHKKDGYDRPWQLIKVDRQIVATVKLCDVDTFYCDDANLAKLAKSNGINVVMAEDLPLPEGHSHSMFPLPDKVDAP